MADLSYVSNPAMTDYSRPHALATSWWEVRDSRRGDAGTPAVSCTAAFREWLRTDEFAPAGPSQLPEVWSAKDCRV